MKLTEGWPRQGWDGWGWAGNPLTHGSSRERINAGNVTFALPLLFPQLSRTPLPPPLYLSYLFFLNTNIFLNLLESASELSQAKLSAQIGQLNFFKCQRSRRNEKPSVFWQSSCHLCIVGFFWRGGGGKGEGEARAQALNRHQLLFYNIRRRFFIFSKDRNTEQLVSGRSKFSLCRSSACTGTGRRTHDFLGPRIT